jgi:hypothetical protein
VINRECQQHSNSKRYNYLFKLQCCCAFNVGYDENRALVGYVNSPSPAAYPPAVSDGYTYKPLGQLGDKVRIATGSYTGTGMYYSDNPNTLTLGFVPKFFSVGGLTTTTDGYVESAGRGLVLTISNGGLSTGYGNGNTHYKIERTTISWYNDNSAGQQFNENGWKYGYIAIG